MIDYKYADLYYEDSTDKQLNIEAEDGSVITNEDIYAEEMDLDESLCSETSLKFGCCEASSLKLKIANRFSPLYNQWLTVTETIGGNDDEPFLFGKYKVQSDRPTADRSYRDITAYDAMYDIINADGTEVADWYNTILPDDDSTVTLKEFRESFLAFLGIEEVSASLVNDNMIVEKTISTSSLSGRRVITCICEINGVFGHITRDGKFEYIQLEPIDESKAFDIPINKYSDYEDFNSEVINCLQIREDDTDPGVVYGSGANRYIIEGNFLLYGKTTEDLITVTANLYPVINDITYRPATIMSPGNPCIEVGDILHLSTKYQEIYTYALRRSYIGIQAVTDSYMSYGTETYIDDGGSLQEKIEQVKSRTAELADEVKEATETVNIVVEQVAADYASILVLESEVANIQTLFAEYATIEDLQAALATIGELYVTYEEVDYLLADYASIEDLEALYANIETIVANYITADVIRAAVAELGYVTADWIEARYTDTEYLEAHYATITDLDAVSVTITLLDSDVANILNLLAGNVGTGDLQTIVLTAENATIDSALIMEALIGTVLADIIYSNIIYTDNITIMSENGGIVLAGTTMQFSDENGNVRLQLGQDADGNFTFILYDETGTGILIDSEGIHASAVPDGLIVDQMVAEDANISASKINMAEVTDYLNESGDLVLEAYQVTIDGETLDYKLSQITQSIEDLEMEGVVSIENWYALGTKDNPPCDPDEEINDCILGVMILGEAKLGFTNWTTEQPDYLDDEYTWFAQKVTYVGGQVVWTTPTLLTDYYVRNKISVQETELEVVQGQIQARVWLSDIESASDFLQNEITTISDQYGILTVTIDTIDERVGTLTTTVDTYYSELSSQVTAITLDLDGITAEVRDVSEKTANAITEGIPYYAISDDPNWYPPHDPSEEETSVLGTMILGKAVLGISGDDWTTDQPASKEGYYIWICYLRERVDGSTYWTDPTLLTDEWARLAQSEMSEKYSELILTVDSALLQVANIQTDIKENYSTTTEVLAYISESVTDEYATIMQQVSYNYASKDEVSDMTATIEQYVDATVANISLSVSGGSLGSVAYITMTAGEKTEIGEIDLTAVREAFAEEDSEITIAAGQILFAANTLMISSENLVVEADGSIYASNATFYGTMMSVEGDYEAGVSNGSFRIYYEEILMGQIRSSNYYIQSGQSSNQRGFTVDVQNATFGGFSIKNAPCFLINNGLDLADYTQPNQFIENVICHKYLELATGQHLDWVSSDGTVYGYINANSSLANIYFYEDTFLSTEGNDFYLRAHGGEINLQSQEGNIWVQSDGGNIYLSPYTGHVYIDGDEYNSSDENLKKDIEPLNVDSSKYLIEAIDKLEPVEFEWKESLDGKICYGYIANDVKEVLPELVSENEEDELLYLSYKELIPLLHLKIKQLELRIEELEKAD